MFTTLRLLFHIYRLAKDPESTRDAFALIDTLVIKASPKQLDAFEHEVMSDLSFKRMLDSGDEQLIKGGFDLENLSLLPETTLGRKYAVHMQVRNLSQDFYRNLPGRTGLHFLRNRLSKTHDVWHVVTGFETTVSGELGLQAFYGAQIPSLAFLAIILAGFLRTLYLQDSALAKGIFDNISHGYIAGKKAEKLFGVRWEDYWERDIDDVRKEFSIRIPDGRK